MDCTFESIQPAALPGTGSFPLKEEKTWLSVQYFTDLSSSKEYFCLHLIKKDLGSLSKVGVSLIQCDMKVAPGPLHTVAWEASLVGYRLTLCLLQLL